MVSGRTYCVGACIFLLGADDGSRAAGSVDCSLALDNTLPINSSATSSSHILTNPGNVVPVVVSHCGMISVEE